MPLINFNETDEIDFGMENDLLPNNINRINAELTDIVNRYFQ